MFAVFRDGSGTSEAGKEGGWEDFGTVKSRTRENNEDKKEWAGEVMPQKGVAAASKAGGFKLEVFRDEVRSLSLRACRTFAHSRHLQTAAAAVSAHLLSDTDVFSRSSRAPSEADLLRSNPFKNYAAADAGLVTRDPLDGLEVLPRASASASGASASAGSKSRSSSREGDKDAARKVRTIKKEKTGSSTSATTTSKSKTASSSSSSKSASSKPASSDPTAGKPKERVAINLSEIYPNETDEYSPEEVRARKHAEQTRTWGGWEWAAQWDEECAQKGCESPALSPRA